MHMITTGPDMEVHPQLAGVEPDVQGIQLSAQVSTSGEPAMGVNMALRRTGAIRLLTQDNYTTALRQGHQMSNSIWKQDQKSDMVSFLDHLDQRVDPDLVRAWLIDCDSNHGGACGGSDQTRDRRAYDHFLLIDVDEEKLVELPIETRYFALSYVWGQTPNVPFTLLSNLAARKLSGSMSQQSVPNLPQTIRDALTFVKSLHERYLWVDALCIIQDDPKSKPEAVARMHEVYGGAYATIVATHGTNGNAGLPGVQPGTRKAQVVTTIRSIEADRSLYLVSTPPTLGFMIGMSTWDTRGWTFQERLLSRRCIYFTRDLVYFHCPSAELCEAEILKTMPRETEYIKKAETRSIGVSANPLSEMTNKLNKAITESSATKTLLIRTYIQLIDMYTKRNLSVDTDIINAVAGTFAFLREHNEQHFPYGLTSATIDVALLWLPAKPLKRRACLDDQDRHMFPTWSWAGWVGPIQYQLIDYERAYFPTPLVQSYQVNNNEEILTLTLNDQAVFDTSKTGKARSLLDGPVLETGTLHFSAEAVDAGRFAVDWKRKETVASPDHSHAPGDVIAIPLLDHGDRHCGLLFLTAGDMYSPATRGKLEFIAVSRYENGDAVPTMATVERELELADSKAFPKDRADSGIINVLLIESHETYSTRLSVAVIHSRAWKDAEPWERKLSLR